MTRKIILLFLILSTILTLANCEQNSAKTTPKLVPIKVCAMQDISGSMSKTRIGKIKATYFKPILNQIIIRGGEFAFGFINEDSYSPLLRFRVSESELPPKYSSNSIIKGRQEKEYEKKKARLEQRLKDYLMKLDNMLKNKKVSSYTDIYGGLRRADLYLNEAEIFKLTPV